MNQSIKARVISHCHSEVRRGIWPDPSEDPGVTVKAVTDPGHNPNHARCT